MVTRLFKRLGSVKYITALFLSLLSVLISGCADEAALPQAREIEDPQTPPPNPIDQTGFVFDEMFVGQHGCQETPAVSFLNYDPELPIDKAACVNTEDLEGSNPLQGAISSEGLYLALDTALDPNQEVDSVVFADQGSVRHIDLVNNKIHLLKTFSGRVCDVIPSNYFYPELDSATQTETWHKLQHSYVYIETVEDLSSVDACQDKASFRRYYKLGLNYDALADDFSVCAGEPNGRNQANDCKTRLLPAVTQAEAESRLVKAWVDDLETADSTDKKLTFGYLGWGQDERSLKMFDSNRSLIWEQARTLESFDSVQIDGQGQFTNYLVNLNELEHGFYFYQLGRDHFLFKGADLFDLLNGENVFKDRVYVSEENVALNSDTSVESIQFAYDDDELVVYDAGKFFRLDYKGAYATPSSVLTYAMQPVLDEMRLSSNNSDAFSQFEQGFCFSAPNQAECDAANNLSDSAWQFMTPCTGSLGCSFPTDNTDYCVLPSEETASTTNDQRCSSSRFQDLNELDDSANDLTFLGFVKYSNEYIRSLNFEFYNNELLVTIHLLETDALLVYDISQPLSAPKSQREKLLLGERLGQAVMPSIQFNAGLFITTLVKDVEISNRCYKGFQEVSCNLSEVSLEGTGGECTGFDVQKGTCRASTFNYESRALFCTDAQVAGGQCTDDNHVNPATADRQIESADQDAKWVKVLKPSASGIETSVYALVSDAKGPNSVAPGQSAVKDEGVLINPELYSVSLPAVSLDQRLGQISGEVETVAEALVVRNGEAKFSVVTQDFFNNGSARKTQGHFVDESAQTVTPVSSFEYILQ